MRTLNIIISLKLTTMNRNVLIFETPNEACEYVIERLSMLDDNQSKFVALSGGSTPKLLFNLIYTQYQHSINKNIHFFWGDERYVPHQSPNSNYGEFSRQLVETGIISEDQVHPIPFYINNTDKAQREIESKLRSIVPFENSLPKFDLIILGVGEDGHIASIFPDNLTSFRTDKITQIVKHPTTREERITLSGSTINNANEIIILCTGRAKGEILKSVIDGESFAYPAKSVEPSNGNLVWCIDRAAAAKL